jgi:hypothetical protein
MTLYRHNQTSIASAMAAQLSIANACARGAMLTKATP